MRIRKVIFLIFIVSLTACFFAESKQEPVIKKDQGIIVLPQKMKKAIKAFNPDFVLWKTEDYTPKVVNDDRQKDNPKKLPFALIVDANRDNIPDVILDGHDKETFLLIGVISEKDDYRVLLIQERSLHFYPRKMENTFEGKNEYGLPYYLFTLEGTKAAKEDNAVFMIIYPQQTKADYTVIGEGGLIEFRYSNGKFQVRETVL